MYEQNEAGMSTDPQEIVRELESEGITADHIEGFDIFAQSQAAEKEDAGVAVHVKGVDDKPMYVRRGQTLVPVTIRVAGSNSKRCRDWEARSRKKRLKSSALTGEALHKENIQKVAHCTLGWDGFTSQGQEVPCSEHNAAMLYERCPWVLSQVVEAMNDHERFFENGSGR